MLVALWSNLAARCSRRWSLWEERKWFHDGREEGGREGGGRGKGKERGERREREERDLTS